jgi:hypothetical protein
MSYSQKIMHKLLGLKKHVGSVPTSEFMPLVTANNIYYYYGAMILVGFMSLKT